MELKRKRGGQPGNQNARKHGLYSSNLTPQQLCQFWNIINLGGTEPELVALRIKLADALKHAPGNRRVLKEVARLLARWYRSKLDLNSKDNDNLKKYIGRVLEAITEISAELDETNRA